MPAAASRRLQQSLRQNCDRRVLFAKEKDDRAPTETMETAENQNKAIASFDDFAKMSAEHKYWAA
jgi:hypothetical protein